MKMGMLWLEFNQNSIKIQLTINHHILVIDDWIIGSKRTLRCISIDPYDDKHNADSSN